MELLKFLLKLLSFFLYLKPIVGSVIVLLFFLGLNFAFLFALGALAFAFQVARDVSQHA
jgi:hypothetical protein